MKLTEMMQWRGMYERHVPRPYSSFMSVCSYLFTTSASRGAQSMTRSVCIRANVAPAPVMQPIRSSVVSVQHTCASFTCVPVSSSIPLSTLVTYHPTLSLTEDDTCLCQVLRWLTRTMTFDDTLTRTWWRSFSFNMTSRAVTFRNLFLIGLTLRAESVT